MNAMIPFLIFLLSYVIGSFPTAYIVGRINHVNIFEMGSGNMGATNVVRAVGFKWGVFVWLVDSLKGAIAVALARVMMPWDWMAASVIGGISVIVGHNWSFLATIITGKLRGGKGAATTAGTVLLMAPAQVIILIAAIWAAIVLLTRYVSLGVLLAALGGAIWMLILIAQPGTNIPQLYSIYTVAVVAMLCVRHWKNILRLLAGNERRIGEAA